MDPARGGAGDFLAVGDDYHGGDALRSNLFEDVDNNAGVAAVEVAGGLVGEEQLWAVDQCPGNGGALHLAAAELMRKMLTPLRHTDVFQRS